MSNTTYQVIIIGTGFGGISAALNLRKQGVEDFHMIERRSFMGGTWCQNTYPGAQVDVPSPLYSISSEPYPWTRLFATQDELSAYTKNLIQKHGLDQKCSIETTVTEVSWNEIAGNWIISTETETYRAQFVINASGPLSTPVIPEIEDMDNFQGAAFHTNKWNHSVDLRGKRVAVVGSGASAIQVIPAIADKVKQLFVFQRTPHWVIPRPDHEFSPWQQKLLKNKWVYKLLRFVIYWSHEIRVIGFKYSTRLLKLLAGKKALKHLKNQVKDPSLRAKLTPDYVIGCKRILLSNDFYPTLQKDNVELLTKEHGISKFTEQGIENLQGRKIDLDAVIFATGFDAADGVVSYPVIGRNGKSLSQAWEDFPRAYLGTSMPGFPNFFIVTGPNTGIGHTSAIFMIEAQMPYIMDSIREVKDQELKSIEVKESSEEAYTKMIHREMEKTVWRQGGCKSWYQSKSGKVVAMFPGFTFVFARLARNFKLKDHIIN